MSKILDIGGGGYTYGEGVLRDYTAGSVDSFFVSTVTPSTFTCTGVGTIRLWPGASGSKDTGQEGQKQVNDGAKWIGPAILTRPGLPDVEFDSVWGTWNTNEGDDCFNYGGRPAIYSAHWYFGSSDPPGFTGGEGGSEGERIDDED